MSLSRARLAGEPDRKILLIMDKGHVTTRKLVVVGNDRVGKSSLIAAFQDGVFSSGYVPRLIEDYVISVEVNHHAFQIALWDTIASGGSERRLRPLAYSYADAVLLCFSVETQESFDDIGEKWIDEVRHFVGHPVPIYLVGCKADLRTDPHTHSRLMSRGETFIPLTQAEEMAEKIGAAAYFECSSKTGEGVRSLFLHILEAIHDGVGSPVKVRWNWDKVVKGMGCIVM